MLTRYAALPLDGGPILLEYDTKRPRPVMCLQVVYFQLDSYPNSPAIVMCSDDDAVSAVLQTVNEQFEEYAVLSDVLRAICGVLGHGELTGPQTSYVLFCWRSCHLSANVFVIQA
jgi:hypothetical protein